MFKLVSLLVAGLGSLHFFGALPSTNNYSLQSYGFGSGGTAGSSTSNYALEGISGEISGGDSTTSNYYLKPGYVQTEQANVPKVTLTNPSNYYDKLQLVIDQQNNPSDALYALQVQVGSGCGNFSSNIFYVKSDSTLGSSLTTSDYRLYSAWGSGSGTNIIGLSANTTYCIRAKATQGKFTESAYGPSSSAATVGQQISFCLYTNANCAAGGNSVSLNLLANSVANSSSNIGVNFSTNADTGGNVYIYSTGLLISTAAPGTPINSATADLSSAAKGYGAQIVSVSQLNKVSPYDQPGNNVGQLSATITTILSASAPVASGQSAIQLQAKSDNLTKAAADYKDTITVVAAANF